LGSLISLYSIYCAAPIINLYSNKNKFLPFVLIIGLFVWTVVHYFLFSEYPTEELHELTSTWIRSFLGAMIAAGVGVVIQKCPTKMSILWIGILFSFIVLYVQYIVKAINEQVIYCPDPWGYIYYNKIDGVLMGLILISGVWGGISSLTRVENSKLEMLPVKFQAKIIITAFVLYAYVFIFDSRNGVGISTLLALIAMFRWCLSGEFQSKNKRKISIIFLILMVATIFFQSKYNKGWEHFIEDVTIATSIEEYPHWINFEKYSYPKRSDGGGVNGSTYERASWATVGIKLIYENPYGTGAENYSLRKILDKKFGVPDIGQNPPNSHSGFIDLTLKYGVPFTAILIGIILSIIWSARNSKFKNLIYTLVLVICLTYFLGELSRDHAIEILIFLVTFCATLATKIDFKKVSNE
jgi:hypothetical protein